MSANTALAGATSQCGSSTQPKGVPKPTSLFRFGARRALSRHWWNSRAALDRRALSRPSADSAVPSASSVSVHFSRTTRISVVREGQ
jgi:hypothetical protein